MKPKYLLNQIVAKSPSFLKFLPLLILTVTIVFFLRPARDDWNNWSNLRELDKLNLTSWFSIFSNSWCCSHEKRIFMFSWFVQWLLVDLSSLSPYLIHLLLIAVIGWISFRIFSVSVLFGLPLRTSKFVAILTAFSPVTVVVGLWSNNLFFVLPVALALELLCQTMKPNFSLFKIGSILLLSILAGESAIFLNFLIILFSILLRENRIEKFKLFGLFLGASIFIILYRELVAAGPDSILNFRSLSSLTAYFEGFSKQFVNLLSLRSESYKLAEIHWVRAFFLLTLQLLFIVLVTKKNKSHPPVNTSHFINKLSPLVRVMILGSFAASTFLPLIMGVILGIRTGSDYRYLFVPFVFSLLLLSSFLNYFTDLKVGVKRVALVLFLCYSSLLSVVALEMRFNQADLDRKIWKNIENFPQNSPEIIVTYNPYTAYVMPPYYSFAESDFQADWGVAGYIKWSKGYRPIVVKEMKCSEVSCSLTDYYGNVSELDAQYRNRAIYLMSNKVISPHTLSLQDFTITNDYDEYRTYVMRYSILNP